jgi:hypothetical protein
MSIGTISPTTIALASFMKRPVEHGNKSSICSRTAVPVVDDLSTGYSSAPFVQALITNDFWTPPPVQAPVPHVQPVEPVVPETPFLQLKGTVSTLTRKQISVKRFCERLLMLGFPDFAVAIILMKLDLICEKNGKQMVVIRENMENFVKTMIVGKKKVDLMEALVQQLREGSINWSTFINPTNKSFFRSDLSKKEKVDVFKLLIILGFVDPHTNNMLSLPSEWASFSVDKCRDMLWNGVCQSEITTTPLPPPAKGKKRGRTDVEESPRNQDNGRTLSVDELLKIFFTHLIRYILQYRGFAIPLAQIIENAFLGLSPNDFHQLMYFLSSRDAMWVLQRILMEIPHLNLVFPGEDGFLWIDEHFNFSLFNIDEMLSRLPLLLAESNVLHESAISASLKRKRQEQYNSIVREQSQQQFIHALATLRKSKKNMTSFELFFQTLSMVCDDFDYPHTNWELLKLVVIEFITTVYNGTTGDYIMKKEPCEDPLQVFIEYSIERGVFSRSVPPNEVIRVCDSTKEDCLFGEKCSGAHQDPSVNTMWDSKRVFGMCCREYAKTFTCSNKLCQFPHYSGDEFYRALKNGGKDSFHVRNSAKRQKTD